LKLAEFDYELPAELIAQRPLPARDASRLLHLEPDGSTHHLGFEDLSGILQPDDLLVLNDTKVFPARLVGARATGGAVELLLLEKLDDGSWRVLGKPARKLRPASVLTFGGGLLEAEVVEQSPLRVRFAHAGEWDDIVDSLGKTPLPPYIEPMDDESQARLRYQTVYARARGSVAAPTAGLHFTEAVLDALSRRGVRVANLTLHVGHATFAPVRSETISEHSMGIERFEVPPATVEAIRQSRRVVAVGTTTVRALESAARLDFAAGWHESDLFITPGFEFRVVGGLVTNFHLPKSTLLMLVSALGGVDAVRAAYREAVKQKYRFYSFGDAMLVYPGRHGAPNPPALSNLPV
jgi:S-adenosylmethionine:tRNA ribosyltransferase-isomerase